MVGPISAQASSSPDPKQFTPDQINATMKGSQKADFENKVIAWTKSSHFRCRGIRSQIERQWYINMAFFAGRQNVMIMPVAGNSANAGVRLYVPPAPYYRSRPVINRIRPIVRTELSKLTSQKPSATIVPATGEDADLAAAQAGEQIWESIYNEKKIKTIFRQSILWALQTGVGFMKVYWNPMAKSVNCPPDATEPDGDFCYESVTPFHLFVPDLLCEDIEDQPYVIQIQTRSLEWVKLNYPKIKVEPNVMEASDLLNDSFLTLVGAQNNQRNAVLCYEVWVKPGAVDFLPNGGMYTIVGDNLVQFVEGNPYQHGQYPYVRFPHIPNTRFYADSTITDLIVPQREYNRTRGQIMEAKNRMSKPQLLAAQGSIDPSKITTEPGQVVLYKLGYPAPTPLPLQALPSYVLQEIDRLLMDFEDISGQHQVSKGSAPAGVTAATAISYLQEQDDSMLSTTYDGVEEGFEKIGFQTLSYVKQYWDTPRLIKIVGRDGQFNVLSFQGSDLRDNTDIRVEAGSALPTSKSAKQALLMDLMTQGFIPPEKGLELMDVGGVQRLYEEIQVDSAQASRENMRMSNVTQDDLSQYLQTFTSTQIDPQTGQPTQSLVDPNTGGPLQDQAGNPTEPPLIVPVNSYDNHQMHIQVHNNFRKSQQYEQLPPNIKALFEEHVNQHMQMLGMIPGQPAPQQGANPVSSGGMAGGQVSPEDLQSVISGQQQNSQQQMPPQQGQMPGGM